VMSSGVNGYFLDVGVGTQLHALSHLNHHLSKRFEALFEAPCEASVEVPLVVKGPDLSFIFWAWRASVSALCRSILLRRPWVARFFLSTRHSKDNQRCVASSHCTLRYPNHWFSNIVAASLDGWVEVARGSVGDGSGFWSWLELGGVWVWG
jgi:hypothetical protein